jgi:hypothetical protein
MAEIRPSQGDVFFSQKNEIMIQRLLTNDFQRRVGNQLNDKQSLRLSKTIKHYMSEVYNNATNAGKPVQALNTEVLQSVVPDYLSYLRRQNGSDNDTDADPMRSDVSTRFERLQTDRQAGRAPPVAPPNFQLSLEDEGAPSSVSRYEELKAQRELEARRIEEAKATTNPELEQRNRSDDNYRMGQREANQRDASLLALRDQSRRPQQNEILDVPPDPRYLYMGESGVIPNGPRAMGIADGNPTIALPMTMQPRMILPQDNIRPQEDVISYRENEYNLFIYSADRDWVNNIQENRYNFTVNFDPANNKVGYGLSPSTYIKFKNIVRIELVKVIMPTEACDTLTTKSALNAYNTTKSINVFAYPYLQVRIDELNTNGFGTNDGLNNSFGVVSYDAYWASDTTLKAKGFTRLVPKFLKCQKVYYPTPLSTLQKMTIQIQKPDGTQFSTSADALDVSGVVTSAQIQGVSGSWKGPTVATINVGSASYYDTSGEFLWIQTKTWFSQYTFSQGDRINLSNVNFPTAFSGGVQATTDFTNFLTRTAGHIVVDVAYNYITGTSPTATMIFKDGSDAVSSGSNKLGYSNFIIIRNSFNDPSSGLTSLMPFGGSATTNSAFLTALNAAPGLSTGRLLNVSHQIQLIFRVITRDMDSKTHLRPDNM